MIRWALIEGIYDHSIVDTASVVLPSVPMAELMTKIAACPAVATRNKYVEVPGGIQCILCQVITFTLSPLAV